MKIITISIIIFFLFQVSVHANSSISLLKKRQHVVYEKYQKDVVDPFSMFGFSFDTYLTTNMYYILSIMGAVGGSGERGGFGVAMFGLGYEHELADKLSFNSQLLIGGGGGGMLPVNGGFAVRPQIGMLYQMTNKLSIDFSYSYINFTTGELKAPVISLGVGYQMSQYKN